MLYSVCRFQKHLSFPVGHEPIDKIFYISDEITHNACMIHDTSVNYYQIKKTHIFGITAIYTFPLLEIRGS